MPETREPTPAITHHYEENPAPDVEKQLTAGNGNTLIRVSVINSIGSSDAADMEALLPTVTSEGRHGLTCPVVAQVNHGNGGPGDKDNRHRSTVKRR